MSYCQMVLHCYLILRFMFVILFRFKSEKYKEKSKDLGAPETLHVLIEQTLYSNKYRILYVNTSIKNNALSSVNMPSVY